MFEAILKPVKILTDVHIPLYPKTTDILVWAADQGIRDIIRGAPTLVLHQLASVCQRIIKEYVDIGNEGLY